MAGTRALGKSGISTIPLMLGGNVFGWTADRAASFAVLDRFVERGGTLIDTADVYSEWIPGHRGGESERMIGEWLHARGRRDDVQIATKVGMLEIDGQRGLRPDHVARAVDASLKRLQTDYIDLYFSHRDDPETPLADALGAFGRAIEAGKVRAIGASNFTADRLADALATSDAHGLPRYTVLEPHYNLIERNLFEPELQPLATKEDIGVVPFFALARGFLSGKYRSAADAAKSPRGSQNVKFLEGKGGQVLEALDAVSAETGAPQAAIAIAWLAAKPGVTAPIASATSVAQLDQLLDALDLELSADQMARLDAAGA